jgi:hypothetical protein
MGQADRARLAGQEVIGAHGLPVAAPFWPALPLKRALLPSAALISAALLRRALIRVRLSLVHLRVLAATRGQ